MSWFWRILWAIIPVVLIILFASACFFWESPSYNHGKIHYSDWAHSVGWFLTILVCVQIPLGAVIVSIRKVMRGEGPGSVFRPEEEWGPGERKFFSPWLEYMVRKGLIDDGQCKQHPYGLPAYPMSYDNYAMQYPGYNSHATGGASFRM